MKKNEKTVKHIFLEFEEDEMKETKRVLAEMLYHINLKTDKCIWYISDDEEAQKAIFDGKDEIRKIINALES